MTKLSKIIRDMSGWEMMDSTDERVLVAAACALERTQWNPDMDAAPKDGSKILVWGYYKYYPNDFTSQIQWWCEEINNWGTAATLIIPTKWMHIPQV